MHVLPYLGSLPVRQLARYAAIATCGGAIGLVAATLTGPSPVNLGVMLGLTNLSLVTGAVLVATRRRPRATFASRRLIAALRADPRLPKAQRIAHPHRPAGRGPRFLRRAGLTR